MPDTDLVLFDLDGTLVDTAPDMAAALNRVLADAGRPALAYATIRPHVSRGAAGLLTLAFGDPGADDRHEHRRAALLGYYRSALAADSCLFPGMAELLEGLDAARIRWGVVTNKPGWLTRPLLEAFGLAQRASCVVAGDTLAERKPDPAPLQHACRLAGAPPQRSIYVGDDERDILAGRRAGMATIVARFGYLGTGTDPAQWGATAMIDTPGSLWDHLTPYGSSVAS